MVAAAATAATSRGDLTLVCRELHTSVRGGFFFRYRDSFGQSFSRQEVLTILREGRQLTFATQSDDGRLTAIESLSAEGLASSKLDERLDGGLKQLPVCVRGS